MNNEVIVKIDNVINSIKNTYEYRKFIELLNEVDNNIEITNLKKEINDIKKKLVKKETLELREIYNKKNELLNSNELYNEYMDARANLTNIFLYVKDKMDAFVSEFVINE